MAMKRLLEKELLLWKNRDEHLPLLLRGDKQVGKSYLVGNYSPAPLLKKKGIGSSTPSRVRAQGLLMRKF